MSVREKLSRILTYKNQIKTEAAAKGAEITDETPLREYPSKIASLTVAVETGVTTSSESTSLDSSNLVFNYNCLYLSLADYITSISGSTFCVPTTSVSISIAYSRGSHAAPALGALMGGVEGKNVTYIDYSGFYGCKNLRSAKFPALVSINTAGFMNCINLSSFEAPLLKSIGISCFVYCQHLTSLNTSNVEEIGGNAFSNCWNLSTFDFTKVSNIGAAAFYRCSRMACPVSAPLIENIGVSTFSSAAITAVNAPICSMVWGNAFYDCSNLSYAYFPKLVAISGGTAFAYCSSLMSLYLLNNALCTLSNSNAFNGTPIYNYSNADGLYGSIFVRTSLLSNYQTATNWTYFSSRFVGLTDEEIAALPY